MTIKAKWRNITHLFSVGTANASVMNESYELTNKPIVLELNKKVEVNYVG